MLQLCACDQLYSNLISLQRLKEKAAEQCKPKLQEINKQLAEMGYAWDLSDIYFTSVF